MIDPLLTSTWHSDKGKVYIANIYHSDIASVPEPTTFKVARDFGSIQLAGQNDRKFFDPIKTAECNLTIWINNMSVNAFIEDLIATNEGKYYLEIREDNPWIGGVNRLFFGRIIHSNPTLEDRKLGTYTIKAIDGLTLLKTIKWELSDHAGNERLYKLIPKLLNKIDVINKFYTNTEKLFMIASNLQSEDMTDDIEKELFVPYYFTKVQEPKTYTCFEVLEEITKRFNLRLYYEEGIYIFRGFETYVDSYDFKVYSKTSTEVIGIFPGGTFAAGGAGSTNVMLDGGVHFFKPGLKEHRLIPDMSKLQPYDNYYQLFTLSAGSYKKIGTNYNDLQYAAYLGMALEWFPGAATEVPAGTISTGWNLTFKFINSGTTYSKAQTIDYVFNYDFGVPRTIEENGTEQSIHIRLPWSTTPVQFDIILLLPIFTESTEVYMAATWAGFYDENGTLLTSGGTLAEWSIFGRHDRYPRTKLSKVVFAAKNDTDNFEIEETPIISSDTYAGLTSRLKLGDVFSTERWRFRSTDMYEPLEHAWVKFRMKLQSVPFRLYNGEYMYAGQNKPGPSDVITYRGFDYILTQYNLSLKSDRMYVTMHSIPDFFEDVEFVDYSVEETIVPGSNFNAHNGFNTPKRFEFPDTNATELNIPYEIPEATVKSYKLSIRVEANGVNYYVDQIPSASKRQFFQVDWANNKLKFNITIKGYVVVWIYPYFDTNVASS